jgi:cyclopropane fatty-acyl-phospholipid synthase-like methyltransferase
MHLVYRKTCRVCGSTSLTPVISLGEQHLQGSFYKEGMDSPPMRRIDCSLVRCDPETDEHACGLLQMAKSVPPSVLYASYWYRSGTNQTMRSHLAEIAATTAEMIGKKTATVLDVGSNDGTLLRAYPKGFRKFGIDPSNIARDVEDKDLTIVNTLFPSPELDKVSKGATFDAITSIAMFYDLEDPVGFARSIKSHLAPDGLWIVEMSYMPKMLAMNSYDTICHEHLEYYSLAVLEQIMQRADLKVVRVEENDINGGSIRCYVTHAESIRFKEEKWQAQVAAMRQEEFDLELDTDKPYKNFQDRINVHRQKLVQLLTGLKKEGAKIHIYGASTKGNTILQWCGIDNRLIEFAAERNPDKVGARTLGTDIPIISEDESRKMRPNYYLVLPWHFEKEFLKREAKLLESGVGMIFPLPEIRVVKHDR